MNNEVKNVPSLRFPGFTDEWKTVKLGDIAKFSKGAGIPKADINQDGDREAIRYGELYTTYGEVVTNVHSKVVSKPSDILSDANDVLIPSSGETAIDISTATYVGKSGVAIGGDLNIVKTDENGKFLSYYFNHKKRIDIAKLAQGVSVVHLYGSDLKTLKVNLPSEEEQEKIADFFTAVDERIELASLKVEKLETYKRGLTQKIFTRTLRFKRDDGSDFPEWNDVKLGDLFDDKIINMGRGKVISAVDINNKPGDYPIYSSSVKNNGLFGRYGEYMFDKELISWSVDGGGHFFYRPPHKFSITNVSGFIEVMDSGIVNTRFLAYQLQYLHAKQSFDYTTKAHPSVIRNLYALGLPVIEEQQKIATSLSQIDEKITLETGKLEELKKFKKALLQRMFV